MRALTLASLLERCLWFRTATPRGNIVNRRSAHLWSKMLSMHSSFPNMNSDKLNSFECNKRKKWKITTPDHLLLDNAPNIGPLISRWDFDKFRNCWNKTRLTSKTLTLLYQQFSNLLISQQDLSGRRLRALSNNRWSGGSTFEGSNWVMVKILMNND